MYSSELTKEQHKRIKKTAKEIAKKWKEGEIETSESLYQKVKSDLSDIWPEHSETIKEELNREWESLSLPWWDWFRRNVGKIESCLILILIIFWPLIVGIFLLITALSFTSKIDNRLATLESIVVALTTPMPTPVATATPLPDEKATQSVLLEAICATMTARAPTDTPTATNTPIPTDTSTPTPTGTPTSTDTPAPVPTDTPVVPTDTPTEVVSTPTDTPIAGTPTPAPIGRLGGHIILTRYNLNKSEIKPGETFEVVLYWKTEREIKKDYTVTVQLMDDGNTIRGQHDGPPAGGVAPTSTWPVVSEIEDKHSLTVKEDAPSGHYRLMVGMYDKADGRLLEVVDGEGNSTGNELILLAEIPLSD